VKAKNTDINQLNTNAKTRKTPKGPKSIRNIAGIPCKWPPLTTHTLQEPVQTATGARETTVNPLRPATDAPEKPSSSPQ